MSVYLSFGRAFIFACSLGGINACSEHSNSEHPHINTASVNKITGANGSQICNHTILGKNFSLTAPHCISDDQNIKFTVNRPDNATESTTLGNFVIPGSGGIKKQGTNTPPHILNDAYYLSIATDKALILLREDLSSPDIQMPIAELDAIPWMETEIRGIQKSPVFLVAHYPGPSKKASHPEIKSCHVYKLEGSNEVVAHDCPTSSGVSGSPLVAKNDQGGYSVVAIHQGFAQSDKESDLVREFKKILEKRTINFASTVETLVKICKEIKNCDVRYTSPSHITLAIK